jgi:hypothetical protein
LAVSAYNQANTTSSGSEPVGNAAFTQANTAYNLAVSAYNQANTTSSGSEPVGNAAFTRANSAFSTANAKTSLGKSIAMTIVFGG